MKKLNNPERFKHVNYHETDVARTIRRIRREQRAAEVKAAVANVQPIKRSKQA